MLVGVALVGSWLAGPAWLGAQEPPAGTVAPVLPEEPSAEDVRVSLVTMGPGRMVWERFGHNALAIHDPALGVDLAYNWGMFSFDQEGFLGRLLQGTMLYWMAPFETGPMISAYVEQDRSVWVQELALTPAQVRELRVLLATNALPENRFYRYDYYRDNCSTRVRDALDRVLGGRLRAALGGAPTGTTYRSHTRRLLQDMPAMYTGSQLVLSGKADRPIDRWEEAFLPVRLMAALREVRVLDESGAEVPLVRSEREVYRSLGASEPTAIPSPLGWYLSVALVLALVLVGLSRGAGPWTGVPLAVAGVVWSVAVGVGGLVLVGAWTLTDHVFWYPNWNLLQLNPASLVLAAVLAPALFGGVPSRGAARLAGVLGILALVGLLVHAVPGVAQRNGEILAFTVPVHLGLAVALLGRRARREGASRI